MKGEIHLAFLGETLIIFEFELCSEAERILSEGPCFYRRKRLWLDKWVPEAGCVREGVEVGEVWVRLLGLPLFLWDNDFFKQFGDACGSFVAVDKDTVGCQNLNWARILVRIVGENTPSSL